MRFGVVLAVLLMALTPFQAFGAERRVLTLAYDSNESWPWHLGTDGVPETMPGLSVEFLRETARLLDIDIRFVRAPFRRALAMMKGGEVDGVIEASFRPERRAFGAYPMTPKGEPDRARSMFIQSYVFYVRRGERRFRWNGDRIEGLDGMVGALRNTSAAADLRKLGYPVFEVIDNGRGLEMTAAGRLDAVLLLDRVGTAILHREPQFAENLQVIDPPWEEKPYYLMLSDALVEREPELAQSLWSELARIAHSPFAAKRLAEYERALAAGREQPAR